LKKLGILKLFNSCTLTEKILVGILFLVIFISSFQIGNRFWLENSEPVAATGGTFVEGVIGEFNFLNPVLSQTNLDRDISNLVFCGLTRFDPVSNAIVDDIADHSLSPDQRTYIFKIHDNVKWHDGEPVTADDVIFTFRDVIQNENFPNPTIAADFADVEIVKIDEKTVEMALQKKYAFFIYNTTIGLLPEHILGKTDPADLIASGFNLNPIGCGPYQIETVSANAVSLSAFENFHRGQPSIDSVIFRIFGNEEQLLKNIDSITATKDLSEKNFQAFENDARLDLHDFTLPQYVALFFNLDREILQDEKLRLGLQLATDKKAVTEVHGGEVKIIDTPLLEIASSDWKYEFDASRADGALFDAGWKYRESIKKSSTTSEPKITTEKPIKMNSPKFISQPSSEDFFTTSDSEFFLEGSAPENSTKIIVNGYQLSRFVAGNTTWSYKSALTIGTLKEGENEFIVENQDGEFDRIAIFYSTNETAQQSWLSEKITPLTSKITEDPPPENIGEEENESVSSSLRLRYKDNEPLALKLLIPENREEFLAISEEIARQWRERGVKLTIERLPEIEFLSRLAKRDYDAVIFGENLGYNLDAYSFWHSSEARENGSNLSNLKSSAVNAWLEQIRSSFDSSERRKRLANLRDVLSEEVPAVMLFTPTYKYAVDSKINNFNLGHIALKRDRLANLSTWYLHESRKASTDFGIWSFTKWLFAEAF